MKPAPGQPVPDKTSPDQPAPDVRLQTPEGADADAFEARLRATADWLAMLAPALAGIAIILLMAGSPGVERLRNVAFDQFQRWEPRWWSYGTPVRVVDIDEESLARHGPWPWPRRQMAELVESLKGNGAGVIAFDMLFSEPDRYSPQALLAELPEMPEREILAAALSARRELSVDPLQKAFEGAPVVIGMTMTNSPTDSTPYKSRFVTQGADAIPALPRFLGMVAPVPTLRTAARGLGAINYAPDSDLVTRRAPLLMALGPAGGAVVLAPSLAVEALRVAFRAETALATAVGPADGVGGSARIASLKIADAEIPTEPDGSVRLYFAGAQAERRIPAWQILNGDVHRDEILGRIILVGVSARELVDLRATPLGVSVPSVELHAEALEQALTGAWLTRPQWAHALEAGIILLGAGIIAFAARRMRRLEAGLTALLVIFVLFQSSWLAFLRTQTLIDPVIPGLSMAATWLCAALVVHRRMEKDKRFVRNSFRRHLAPIAVERLADDSSALRLGGEMRETSVLACGLPDFPVRAQTMGARAAVALLNWLHTTLTGAALANSGTLDRYRDAGLNAFWNAPVESPNHPDQACAAALAMMDSMARLNGAMAEAAAREGRPHAALRLGIGIASGLSLVGDMGAMQRFDYSVLGENVTEAEKLLAIAHVCGLPILASAGIASGAKAHWFAPLGNLPGGDDAASQYFALHAKSSAEDSDFNEFLELHQEALGAIERQDRDADSAITAALANPAGARYASFYAWKSHIGAHVGAREPGFQLELETGLRKP